MSDSENKTDDLNDQDVIVNGEERDEFYGKAKDYWAHIPASVDGMLGGFSHISSTDISGSTQFLRTFIRGTKATTGSEVALDCGAGIGRITKRLLLPHFKTVDMVELTQEFLDKAPDHIGPASERVANYFCCGLQDFIPETGRYDVIWCQWVLGHLTDPHLITFFKRCQKGLKENGLIIVKENVLSSDHEPAFDRDDSSYTRPTDLLEGLIKQAGLTIVANEKQKRFPKEIYEVRMYALK